MAKHQCAILLVFVCLVCVSSGKHQGNRLSNYFSRNLGDTFTYGDRDSCISARKWSIYCSTSFPSRCAGRAINCGIRKKDGCSVSLKVANFYETENDKRSQQGQLIHLTNDTILKVSGQYTTDYGSHNLFTKYTSDESGYRASVRFGVNEYKNTELTLPPYVPHYSVTKGKGNGTVSTTEKDVEFLPPPPQDISSAALASLAGGGIG